MGNLNLRPNASGLARLEQQGAHINRLAMSRRVSSTLLKIATADMTIQNSSFSTANDATYTDLSGATADFTLEHPTPLLFIWSSAVRVSAGSLYAYVTANVYHLGGSLIGSADGTLVADSRNGGYVSLTGTGTATLPAGSYTVKMQVATDSGVTLAVRAVHLDVFQLGTRDT